MTKHRKYPGEWYADWDEDTGAWLVVDTELGFAKSSYSSKVEKIHGFLKYMTLN